MTSLGRRFRCARVTAGLFLLAATIACEAEHDLLEHIPSPPAQMPASTEDSIRDAAIDFVQAETAVPDVVVRVEAVADGWARARIEPPDGLTDPAVMYLQRRNGAWRGMTIGTAFAPDELDRLGVAPGVRPE